VFFSLHHARQEGTTHSYSSKQQQQRRREREKMLCEKFSFASEMKKFPLNFVPLLAICVRIYMRVESRKASNEKDSPAWL
jgi:hypothetical protein